MKKNTLNRISRHIYSTAAETLAEVMIAVVVLGVGAVGATVLVYGSIAANADGKERIIAYNLAREGVEAFRNIRDTNWLRFPGNRTDCWDVTLQTTSSVDCITGTKIGDSTGKDYIVYPDLDDSVTTPTLFDWILDEVDPATDDITLYAITIDGGTFYTHDSSGDATIYSRSINVVKDSVNQTMTITSTVTWETNREKSVVFMDELTNY